MYRSVLPNGRVVYGDAPAPTARRSEAITVERHPPNAQDAEAAGRALALSRQQLMRDADARAARIRQLDNQVGDTYDELQRAQVLREQGREVQEGDRQGRRWSARYAQRQQSLDAAVQQVQRRLDKLVGERAALQY